MERETVCPMKTICPLKASPMPTLFWVLNFTFRSCRKLKFDYALVPIFLEWRNGLTEKSNTGGGDKAGIPQSWFTCAESTALGGICFVKYGPHPKSTSVLLWPSSLPSLISALILCLMTGSCPCPSALAGISIFSLLLSQALDSSPLWEVQNCDDARAEWKYMLGVGGPQTKWADSRHSTMYLLLQRSNH